MYETDNEINGNRRKFLIWIIVILFVITLLVLVILIATKGKNKKVKEKETHNLTCELEVANNVAPGSDGAYTQSIEIVYKNINVVSDKFPLVKKTIGITDSSVNKETYTITRTGSYTVTGYLQDSNGNTGTCSISVEVRLGNPSCELEATSAEIGENGWYRKDVEVTFKDMSTNNPETSIVKYYIEKKGVQIDVSSRSSNDTYIVTDDNITELTGYVIDSYGGTGACEITVKKDSISPTCSLKVTSGNKDGSGVYTTSPTIGFDTAKDNLGEVKYKGIGLSQNYTDATYTLNTNGGFIIYGYVKDDAGNQSTCSIPVKRNDGSGIQDTGKPSCLIYIDATKLRPEEEHTYIMYKEKENNIVKVHMTTSANTAAYGIGPEEIYNGQKEYVIDKPGTYTITGWVVNASGEKESCSTPQFIVKGALLGSEAKIGDFVNYESSYTPVRCDQADENVKFGWRVLDILNNGQVVLVSNGATDCIEHGTSSSTTISHMKQNSKKYLNVKYASNADILDCNSQGANGCLYSLTNSKLYKTGAYYFMGTSASNTELWAISPAGLPEKVKNKQYGMRTVITLDALTLTTGKTNGAWNIMK